MSSPEKNPFSEADSCAPCSKSASQEPNDDTDCTCKIATDRFRVITWPTHSVYSLATGASLTCESATTVRITANTVGAKCNVGWAFTAGVTTAGSETSDDCTACEAGKTAAIGATTCSFCAAGKSSTKVSAAGCTNCAAGKTSVSPFQACVDCSAGTTSAGGDACANCAVGKINVGGTGTTSSVADNLCTDCAAGTSAAVGASTNTCVACAGGTTSAGGDACVNCAVGKINVGGTGTTSSVADNLCTDCAAGQTAAGGNSANTCEDCHFGTDCFVRFAPADGLALYYAICGSSGYYNPNGNNDCIPNSCLFETADGSCPIFAETRGPIGDWDVSKVTDFSKCTFATATSSKYTMQQLFSSFLLLDCFYLF